MSHVAANKKLLARVRRISGQTQALERALASEPECLKILQQIAAIKGAVNGLMKQVLESHLREHLCEDTLTIEERQKEVEDVISLLNSYLK